MASKIAQPEPLGFTLSEVEAALAQVEAVPVGKRGAFNARLKNLLKLGLLPEAKAGRGASAVYTPDGLFRFGLAITLAQLGLTPSRTVSLMQQRHEMIAAAATLASLKLAQGKGADADVLIVFDPSCISEMSGIPDVDFAELSFRAIEAAKYFRKKPAEELVFFARESLVNVSALLRYYANAAAAGREDHFYTSVAVWGEGVYRGSNPQA